MHEQKKPKLPNGVLPLTDLRRPYVHSSSVDVQSTWRRFGWEPPFGSQDRGICPTYEKKGSNR